MTTQAQARNALEQSVLGAILVRTATLAELPALEASDFAIGTNRQVFTAMRNLEASNKPVDVVTVEAALAREYPTQNPADWAAYLGELSIRVPTVENAIEYATQLRDAALGQRVRNALADVLDKSSRMELSGAELLSLSFESLSAVDFTADDAAAPVGELVQQRVRQLEGIAADRASGARSLTGFPTGVAALDDRIGGWQSKIVSIVCARPAMGKSSLGLATADACSAAGFGVHLFSLEDTEESYADRTLSRSSQVPAEAMRNAALSRVQMRDIAQAIVAVRKRPWLVDSRSGISADEIVRSARKHKRGNNTRVVIVDYVQLVRGDRRLGRHEQLSEIITTLADAAKHDDIAYVVMSQLNRSLESRSDKRPMLSDLRESGSLEERAKCVVGLYRGAYYNQKPQKGIDYPDDGFAPLTAEYARQLQLLVLKNSNGKVGTVLADFDGPTTRVS